MSFTSQMDLINYIEDTIPVDKWKVDGFYIWPLLRISLGMQLSHEVIKEEKGCKQEETLNKISKAKKLLQNQIKYAEAYFKDYSQNDRTDRKVNAVFLGNQVSRTILNKTWYDRLCDPLISEFNAIGMKCLQLDLFHTYRIPRYSPGVFIQPQLDFLAIKNLLIRKKANTIEINLQDFDDFNRFLRLNQIDINFSIEKIVQLTHRIRLYADFFKKILLRVRPQISFIVSYYSLEGMAFNLACREIGIPSVDIQHGVEGDLHCAYGRWNRIPENGYELLPNVFWVWSEYEADAINKWCHGVERWHRPFIGGNPWLNLWEDEDNSIYQYYNNQFNIIPKLAENGIKVLLTLQPGVPNYGFSEWLVDAINKSPADWFWLIRLHPCMINEREKVKKLLKGCSLKNVNIDESSDLPLPLILKKVDVHVTHSSSTILEAQVFGVPSVALNDIAKELYHEQVESSWLVSAYDSASLISMIKEQYDRRGKLERRYFQASDTSASLKQLFDQTIGSLKR
jgi:hypothetical protein